MKAPAPDENHLLQFHAWLRKNKLTQDPFASSDASREISFLNTIFIEPDYFREILGDPHFPRPSFLIAERGSGKTTTCEMVAYECYNGGAERRALPVRYFDFYPLVEKANGGPITLRHHVWLLARSILKAMAEDVLPHNNSFAHMSEDDRALLACFASSFADPRTKTNLLRALQARAEELDWEGFSPLETMEMIAGLVTRILPPGKEPYLATYILVDRVDETRAGPDAALEILKPLVSETPVLETPHLGFKFFLPAGVAEDLRKTVHLREDRMVIKRIEWDHESLLKMVNLRVQQFCSPIGYKQGLEDLCDSDARHRVMGKLLGTCGNSPRTLLQLCSSLLHRHVLESSEAQIKWNTVMGTVREFEREREAERMMESRESALQEIRDESPQKPPERGLFMDQDGQVWVDGKLLEKPLTRNESTLLKMLYSKSPAVLSQDALIQAIWPESSFDRDEQNLRKLVGRLRKRLVTGEDGDDTRFIKNAKGMGYRLERN